METVDKQIFINQKVTVDGKTFRQCSFQNVTLHFAAGMLPSFEDCTFDNVTLKFDGAADNTLRFLSGLYQGNFSNSVEAIMAAIHDAQEVDSNT